MQQRFAGGPRLDSSDGGTAEDAQCWVDGYDAGFAGKYDKGRADECINEEYDEYNAAGDMLVMTLVICQMNVKGSKIIQ